MTVTTQRHAVARRLEEYRRQPGNWRLKGLLLSLADGVRPETVGRVWPRTRPTTGRGQVHLGLRHPDTAEHAPARELFGADAIDAGEVVPRDEYVARMLVSGTTAELDVLWREELLDTVHAGAAGAKIARDATTVTPVEAKKGDLTAHGHEPFASDAAEGGGGIFDEEDTVQIPYNAEKFDQGFGISEELIDQAEVAQIERGIEAAGAAVEGSINRQHLLNVVDNANQDHGSVGNSVQVKDVFEAMENVSDGDFDPVDILVMHPEFRTEFADKAVFVTADDPGEANTVGPELFVQSDATYNGLSGEADPGGSNTWGWEAANEIGAVVYGRNFVHTVVYKDISISELEPPITAIHDIQGGVARASTDSVQVSNDAISTITQ